MIKMSEFETLSRRDISEQMRELRNSGNIPDAIALCEQAIQRFPRDYFYPKIAGDLYFQQGDYETASVRYIEFLSNIPSEHSSFSANRALFPDFANRYNRLRRVWPQEKISKYAALIMVEIRQGQYDKTIASHCRNLIKPDLLTEIEISEEGQRLGKFVSDDANFNIFIPLAKKLETNNPTELESILNQFVLNRRRSSHTIRIDEYCISVYERWEQYENALKISRELFDFRFQETHIPQGTIVRAILRICRTMGNYKSANDLLSTYPQILKISDFNIFYELVYYFEAQDAFEQVRFVLGKMERGYKESLPIQKTAKNLYVRFGLLEDAERVENHISELYSTGKKSNEKFAEEVQESEVGIWHTIKELSSQLEYQTQLGAISELTTGISHELGQPITNIRYTVQFYRRLFKKEIEQEIVLKVFDSILEETERMGGLIKRLSPITSSKNTIESFDLIERIRKRVSAENLRLLKRRIGVDITPQSPMYLTGDPVKFDQLVSNLLLNAIDSIYEKNKYGEDQIKIQLEEHEDKIAISFADTGTGISAKYRKKLFTPFFSTKSPGKGEGLGLFIVWNLLKMQGGTIILDDDYTGGARFLITIPKTKETK